MKCQYEPRTGLGIYGDEILVLFDVKSQDATFSLDFKSTGKTSKQ